MATLTRPRLSSRATDSVVSTSVPTPFPRDQLDQIRQTDSISVEDVRSVTRDSIAGPSHSLAGEATDVSASRVTNELMPSIAYVQKSCLMTLNDLLSVPYQWSNIIPDRHHSAPSAHRSSGHENSSPSALQTLVQNLRNQDDGEEMFEIQHSESESDLIRELRLRVDRISSLLRPDDAALAHALVSLLSHIDRLSVIQASYSEPTMRASNSQAFGSSDLPPAIDIYDSLQRQLNDLQIELLSSQNEASTLNTSLLNVETTLLWSNIDQDLETVVSMCRERTETLHRYSRDYFPPQYEDFSAERPPEYEPRRYMSTEHNHNRAESIDTHVSQTTSQETATGRQVDEKMKLDLEAITMAIDRLYLVAPQLHNQRVELKSSKLAQMERARQEGTSLSPDRSTSRANISKGKERDEKELEAILELLDKATGRKLVDQSVVLEHGMHSKKIERARLRESAKRDAFVDRLMQHSSAGRMRGQEYVPQVRVKDPETLLTLPEFIRESMPQQTDDKDKTDYENDEPVLETLSRKSSLISPEHDLTPVKPIKKKTRSRSLSAPPFSWLRASSSKLSTQLSNPPTPSKQQVKGYPGFDVIYVAENHDNLQHVLVFFNVTGANLDVGMEAEVLPPSSSNPYGGGDQLVIKNGFHASFLLLLPAHVIPGRKEVRQIGGHYEIKLPTIPPMPMPHSEPPELDILLGASTLLKVRPTSFICASCSLPLVQSSKIYKYRDLPSEHWEELVEAWMCHPDQRLHEEVTKYGKAAFWPRDGEALVGGSYIIFEESSMIQNNLHHAEEMKHDEVWRLVRCICGAVVGRCQDYMAYRILKYATRPVSETIPFLSIPLSAFIIQDMTEFVQAHASYRFIIRDDEDELPRILIWLFKPNIAISYKKALSHSIEKSATIRAAKVLYKLFGPGEATYDLKSILQKYPGFPQAEYLSYPMAICRRLAGFLKESNQTYPEGMRVMTGLQVGWLERVFPAHI